MEIFAAFTLLLMLVQHPVTASDDDDLPRSDPYSGGEACGSYRFRCDDGKCIPRHWKCDSKRDCDDGSDEPEECSSTATCRPGEFQCSLTRRCISRAFECDGEPDCGMSSQYGADLSDEDPERCHKDTNVCSWNEAACHGTTECLPLEKFCDGTGDCPNHSDEWNYCTENKSLCDVKQCAHGCKLTYSGAECFCPKGRKPDGNRCIDADECELEASCAQLCQNTDGSFECSCVSGYNKNGNDCIAINVPETEPPSLIISTQTTIKRVTLAGKSFPGNSTLHLINSNGLEFSHRNRSVCYVHHNVSRASIVCADVDDLNRRWVLSPPSLFPTVEHIQQMSLDWVAGNWYFLDDTNDMIFMCGMDLTKCRIVLENDLQKPRGIALDPTRGYLFFTKYGRTPASLERVKLDGSERKVIVSYKIAYPYGVTVDYPTSHVYWVDTYLDYVGRVDFDGRNRITIMKGSTVKNLYGVTIFGSKLYVSSWQNDTFLELDIVTKSAKGIVTNFNRPFNLHVFHRQRQPEVAHPCKINNGNCQHLCVTAWNNDVASPHCVCSAGYRLIDGKQCVVQTPPVFLLVAKGRPASVVGMDLIDGIDTMIPITTQLAHPSAIEFDASTRSIFIADEFRKTVEKITIEGGERTVLLDGLDKCDGLAYDYYGKNLYWTDGGKSSISVISTSSKWRRTLIYDLDMFPRELAIHPLTGLIFWVNKPVLGVAKIESAWMDGTHRTTLIMLEHDDPRGLTIDYTTRRLYWTNNRYKRIESITFTGTHKTAVLENPSMIYPYALTLYKGTFFTAEYTTGKIFDYNGSNDSKPFYEGNSPILALKIFDAKSQNGTNGCSTKNNCAELCLTIPSGVTCGCSDGYELDSTKLNCRPMLNYKPPVPCPAGQFKCRKDHRCIPADKICDGVKDCRDGTDENNGQGGYCLNHGACDGDRFRCSDDVCIASSWLCDGEKDCVSGEDENTSNCQKKTCSSEQFLCAKTMRCIPLSWVCDNSTDCGEGDNSDEAKCIKQACAVTEFACENGRCIPDELYCNGIDDCKDGTDETDCIKCDLKLEFPCMLSKKCLPLLKRCDKIIDCSDGSDELNCDEQKPICELHNEFACKTLECIGKQYVCDGSLDCIDGSDEKDCLVDSINKSTTTVKPELFTCDAPMRLCDNGTKCLSPENLCDNRFDCDDGSDEGPRCDEKLCEHSLICSHVCHNVPEGLMCSCPKDLHLATDKINCLVTHPCDVWGTCSQLCERFRSRYKCKCLPGYTLESDGFSCKSNDARSPYVIFSNRHEIKGVDLHTFNVKAFISSLKNTIALDFFHSNDTDMVFWTDVIDDKIYRGTLVGNSLSNIEPVVQTGLATAEGLAVDWIGENLYWVESNLDQIEVARLNGNFRRTLVAGEMESPRAIALDPRDGWLFWTDWDNSAPRIERCSLAGLDRSLVIRVDLEAEGAWPNGLTLDYTSRRIYWIDARSDSIHTIRYDGSDHHTVVKKHDMLSHPFAITLFENYVYWTDWRANSVVRANKWTGGDVSVIQKTLTQPFDIQILHPSRQPRNGKNPCGVSNGGCSHLCLLHLNSTFKCDCPHVMRLHADNKTCVVNERVLLIARTNEIRGVDLLQPYYHTIPTISLPYVLSPSQIEYLASNGTLFWTDSQISEVKRSGLTMGPTQTLIDTGTEHPSGLAVDWVSNLLFISSPSGVVVCNLDAEYSAVLLSDVNVISLAVDPPNGRLFFVAFYNNFTNIESVSMDGSERHVLISNLTSTKSLSYDLKSDRLYYVNNFELYYYDFKIKSGVKLLINGTIACATVYKDLIYYADDDEQSIRVADKTTGGQGRTLRNSTGVLALRIYDPSEQSGEHPCGKRKAGCQHLCLPKSTTTFTCKCATGFLTDPKNTFSCIPIDEFLFYSINWEIRGIPLDGSNGSHVLGPISRVSMASTIDYLAEGNLIFWADSDHAVITSINRDGTNRKVVIEQSEVIETASDWLAGLAVDWSAGNVYWSDPKHGVIEVSRLDGSARYVVLSQEIGKPSAIAVDPAAGLLVWGGGTRLESSALDGTNRKLLVNVTNGSIQDIALDLEHGTIYWCDSLKNTIESITYDGLTHVTLLNHSLENPVALTVLNETVYWVDTTHDRGSIKCAGVGNASDFRVLLRQAGDSLKDVQIFSRHRQRGKNLCAENNGGCEQLCLFNGTHPLCACSHGVLDNNGKTCKEYDSFVMFSKVVSVDSIHMTDANVQNAPFASIKNSSLMKNAIGLSFDYLRQRVFYSDIQRGSINVVHFNGTGNSVIVEKQGSVEGVAYEQVNNALYWTCNNDPTISRTDLSSFDLKMKSSVEIVVRLKPQDKPRGIAVDSCGGRVYWTNWNSHEPSIDRAYFTGFRKESIITSEIRMPNALTLDHKANKIYWSDARLDKIERCEYDGSARVVLAKVTPQHPFGLAVYGNLIFWTDWMLHAVLRADKLTGRNVVWLRRDVARPMGIIAVANDTNDCFSNPCLKNNGECDEFCGLTANGAVQCNCSEGKSLGGDGRSCYNKTSCENDSFRCSDGGCIPYILTCDGVPHCVDSSDEEPGYCGHRICTHMYQCTNKRCIQTNQVCNGVDNCGDGSDEANCTCNENSHFRCTNGQCILNQFRCDEDPDCLDASDEIGCPPRNCSFDRNHEQMINCPDTTACMLPEWFCDNENDCWDGSDEKNCTKCASDEFQCAPGKCIPSVKTCDGVKDCDDGSDEDQWCIYENNGKRHCGRDEFSCDSNSVCIPLRFRCNGQPECQDESDEHGCIQKCRSDQFKCDDKDCIPLLWICDGQADCKDGSDESAHCKDHVCNAFQFRCNSTGRCIPLGWLCDGDHDCTDHADEHPDNGCSLNICKENEFQCTDGACIAKFYFCDGDHDCTDKSDEPDSCDRSCYQNEFKCSNGTCIEEVLRCNGHDDCGDGSDEHDCPPVHECLGNEVFLCENGICLNETLVCNARDDCGDFSDELKCNIDECSGVVVPCSQICVDKPIGYECSCNPGYKVSHKDPGHCEDINECEERPCSQLCQNTVGSYRCKCADGYKLSENGSNCRADSNVTVKLLLANRYYIRELNLDGISTLLVHNLTNAVALDYDWETQCIFWSDVTTTSSSIKKFCNDSKTPVTLHSATLQNPDGLVVDWVGKNLYWCDKGLDTLEVSTLEGKYRKVLISTGLQEPRGVALDPIRRNLYWTDWGTNVHIGKAGMDGSNPTTIVSNTSLGWPNALTISYDTNEMFWADAREDYIAVADLNGENMRIIASRRRNPALKLHHVFAISVWENFVYWTDWETKSIERCDKYKGNNCKTLLTTVHRPMDLRIVHPLRQPRIENPCAKANCSGLCLLSPSHPYYVCACPENYELMPDGRCQSNCTQAYFECASTYKCIPFWWKCDTQDDCGDGSDEPESCPPFRCTPGQYQCENKDCIHPSQLCNGNNDCRDNSDELNCHNYTCINNQFKCEGNATVAPRCVSNHQRCDHQIDCPLGEDELNCPPSTCPPHQFKCDNNKCIPSVWVCDRDNDCGDNTDEADNCSERTCPSDHFRCNTGRCIPNSWCCDGEFDCPENEDEPPTCRLPDFHTCEPTYFKCNSSRCIPGRWRCDYDNDCDDGSDEYGCEPRNCSESEMKCKDGRCIRRTLWCDGEFHCDDKSDELECNMECEKNEFQCVSPHYCISLDWKCDGDTDCADGSDELNCSDTCPDNGFQCDNGMCINEDWRCDGQDDCEDGSDESPSLCSALPCPTERLQCKNHRCIPHFVLCDGKDDCGDGNDEEAHVCSLLGICPVKKFQCANRKCIDQSLKCDGYDDCGDYSDENQCDKSACHFGHCSQQCLETKTGNYSCKCVPGYQPNRNGSCKAQGRPANLIIAAENELRFISPYNSGVTNQVKKISLTDANYKVDAVDTLYQSKVMVAFWTDHHNKRVQSMQVNLEPTRSKRSAEPKIVMASLNDPRGLSVDWVAKRIYVTDQNRIIVSTIDGKLRYNVVTEKMQQLRDIVVAPLAGLMFWTDWGPPTRIERAHMDGNQRGALELPEILWPTGLAIDHPAERLYWADAKAYTIESSDFYGADRQVIRRFGHDERPFKLEVFEDAVYFTTHHNHNVMRMNKFGRGNVTHLAQGLPRLANVLIVHEQKQKNNTNACLNFCGPSELCLLKPDGATCVCADGFVKEAASCRLVETNVTNCPLKCNAGLCNVTENGPKCACPPLYSGPFCEHYRCSQFCKNKGMCYADLLAPRNHDGEVPLLCNCPPQWMGERCEIPVNNCEGRCFNGGTCSNIRPGVAVCTCKTGYTGTRCQHCSKLTCQNGGVCSKTNNKENCECPREFYGRQCELPYCVPDYCMNQGSCDVGKDGIKCKCLKGFSGVRCERNLCENHCLNGGTCQMGLKEPLCDCPGTYSGRRCSVDLCQGPNPPVACLQDHCNCANNGSCVKLEGNYRCRCGDVWGGTHCEDYMGFSNPCIHRCQHDGICEISSLDKRPVCHCTSSWTGERCDESVSCRFFCLNGGTCQLNGASPFCVCPLEYGGIQCEIPTEHASKAKSSSSFVPVLVGFGLLAIVTGFAVGYIFLRRRRPFTHERLQENDFNNPMYQERDAEPFSLDTDKGTNFVNPVYETVFNGSTSAKEEKTGLLQQQSTDENPPSAPEQ